MLIKIKNEKEKKSDFALMTAIWKTFPSEMTDEDSLHHVFMYHECIMYVSCFKSILKF